MQAAWGTECSEELLSVKDKEDLSLHEKDTLLEVLAPATVQSRAAVAQLRRGMGTERSAGFLHRVLWRKQSFCTARVDRSQPWSR